MGSDTAPPPGLYVRQLMEHAGQLRAEARVAFEAGDYERAAMLLDRAEMLADDVGELVDAIEERQTTDVMRMVAEHHAAASVRASRLWQRTFPTHARKLGAALGASIAMTLALAEC